MKSIKLLLSVAVIAAAGMFTGANANPNNVEKISKMTRDVLIEPTKTGNAVTLELYLKTPENIAEMTIERGTVLGESFRQVKSVTPAELASIQDGKLVVNDLAPLPSSSNVFYRAVVVDKEGIIRFFPASSMVSSPNSTPAASASAETNR
jgi:hypothetical protein